MEEDKNTSGILGLSGEPVPKSPDDPTTEFDEKAEAKRRARRRDGEAESRADADARENPKPDHAGATGIDMGAGGHGTDVSGE